MKVKSKFNTKFPNENRIAYLMNFYSKEKHIDEIEQEAKQLSQGDRELSEYYNYKLKWMRAYQPDITFDKFVDHFRKGLNPSDKLKIGYYQKGLTFEEFEQTLMKIEIDEKQESERVNMILFLGIKNELFCEVSE